MNAELQLRNRQLMGKLVVIAAGMLGFGFAMVPMYRQICDAIGITDTRTVGAVNTQVDTSREVTVELLASRAGLPGRGEARARSGSLNPGALATVRYRVVNDMGRPVTAHAVMNTAPAAAAQYIQKTECFCFTDQTLQPGEVREMPIVFRVSAQAPRDLTTISLSYTFFEARKS